MRKGLVTSHGGWGGGGYRLLKNTRNKNLADLAIKDEENLQ